MSTALIGYGIPIEANSPYCETICKDRSENSSCTNVFFLEREKSEKEKLCFSQIDFDSCLNGANPYTHKKI